MRHIGFWRCSRSWLAAIGVVAAMGVTAFAQGGHDHGGGGGGPHVSAGSGGGPHISAGGGTARISGGGTARGNATVRSGGTNLNRGTATLNRGATNLNRGATNLNRGTTTLNRGTTTLNRGTTTLNRDAANLSRSLDTNRSLNRDSSDRNRDARIVEGDRNRERDGDRNGRDGDHHDGDHHNWDHNWNHSGNFGSWDNYASRRYYGNNWWYYRPSYGWWYWRYNPLYAGYYPWYSDNGGYWGYTPYSVGYGNTQTYASQGASLGVQFSRGEDGAVINNVIPGSPADRAGLKPGDAIVSVNGRSVDSFDQVIDQVARSQPGDRMQLEVDTGGGRTQRVDVRLAARGSY